MRVSFPHTLESKAERNSTHENRVSDFQREASSTTLGSEINKQKMRTGARVQKGGKEYNVGIIEAQTQTRRRRRRGGGGRTGAMAWCARYSLNEA